MSKIGDYSKRPVWFCVLTIDRCALTYGSAPCTAAVGTTGQRKCFNTFETCQDRPNYDLETVDLKFCSVNENPFPGEIVKPYITGVSVAPTEIKDTKVIKASVTLNLADEPDNDVGLDKYISDRDYDPMARGTFWRKFIARNPNYKGRPLALYEGYEGDAVGEYTQVFLGRLENITIRNNGGVSVSALDNMTRMDDVLLPPNTDLKLVTDVNDSVTSMTLSDSDELFSTPGYLLIGTEMIYYTTVDAPTNVISGITRGVRFTTATEHSSGDKCQPVYHRTDNPFNLMTTLLLTDVGYAAGEVDSTAFTTARDQPGVEPDFECFIKKPTKASDIFFEMVDLCDSVSWQAEDLKITIARQLPNLPGRTYRAITDGNAIIRDSIAVDLNPESRTSRVSLHWDVIGSGDPKEVEDYLKHNIAIDVEAESAVAFNQIAEEVLKARCISTGTVADDDLFDYAAYFAIRRVYRKQKALTRLVADLEEQYADIKTGEFTHVSTDRIVDATGLGIVKEPFMVIKRQRKDKGVRLTLQHQPTQKFWFWAAAGTNDYADATDAEKETAFFAAASGKITPQNVDGYAWY